MLLCILSGKRAQHITQITRGNIQLFRKILDGRYSLTQGSFIAEIFIQNVFQLLQQIVAYCFAGDELTLIKPIGVVQQQLNLRNNDILAKIVYSAVHLLLDDCKNGNDGSLLLLR